MVVNIKFTRETDRSRQPNHCRTDSRSFWTRTRAVAIVVLQGTKTWDSNSKTKLASYPRPTGRRRGTTAAFKRKTIDRLNPGLPKPVLQVRVIESNWFESDLGTSFHYDFSFFDWPLFFSQEEKLENNSSMVEFKQTLNHRCN